MKKNNSYGLLRLIEDSGWMGIEYLTPDSDGMHKIYLIRSFYNSHKIKQPICEKTGQLKLI
jgi:hypothetical protein